MKFILIVLASLTFVIACGEDDSSSSGASCVSVCEAATAKLMECGFTPEEPTNCSEECKDSVQSEVDQANTCVSKPTCEEFIACIIEADMMSSMMSGASQ
jgi:hypothetical protein